MPTNEIQRWSTMFHSPRPDLLIITSPLHMELVRVPAGKFLLGSDKEKDLQAYDDEFPQQEVTLPDYWIGRTLVTVAQFRVFVEESGYDEMSQRNLKDSDNHPVRYVTLRDTLAYCRWLSAKTALEVTLPSEVEWEKAARGTGGQIYPWGNDPPTAELCNFGRMVDDTTPVGKYSPKGDSPYGCTDMAGNVWEWTRSLAWDYPYDPDDGREDLEASGRRVLRGGAFAYIARLMRCAFRLRDDPYRLVENIGFRVVASSSQTA